MNKEIKEILENIKCPQLGYDEYGKWGALPLNVRITLRRLCDYVVSCDDYITNLQQIEQDHKQTNATLMSELTKLEEEKDIYKNQLRITHKDLENYISRCEKAIEYIQDIKNITKHGIYPNYTYEVDTRELLNILQNGSDKE